MDSCLGPETESGGKTHASHASFTPIVIRASKQTMTQRRKTPNGHKHSQQVIRLVSHCTETRDDLN
jgi:hypothetical protein